jgi:hypothetical protein
MNGDHNIADLLRQLRDDTATLVREEVELAKTEIREKVAETAKSTGFLVAGGLVASSALLVLLMSLGYLLSEIFMRQGMNAGMAAFLGFLIVAVISGVAGWMLISHALKQFGRKSITPDRTVQSLREDKQWAQNKMS